MIRSFPDLASLSLAAAERLAGLAQAATAEDRVLNVALSGGRTPDRFFEILAEPPFRLAVPWGHVRFLWADERAVEPGHPDSNYGRAKALLLDQLPEPRPKVLRMRAELRDLDKAAREYAAALVEACGADRSGSPVPVLDLAVLGLGQDGHTASLFPGSPVLGQRLSWVSPATAPDGSRRLTLTLPVLAAARARLFLVAGELKARALMATLQGERDPVHWPAQSLARLPGTEWLVDAEAGSGLRAPEGVLPGSGASGGRR